MRSVFLTKFVVGMLISNCAYGQLDSLIIAALDSKSFNNVEEILKKNSIGFSIYETNYYRELIDNYYEYHFSYSESSNISGYISELSFKLNLITSDSSIIYYHFSVEKDISEQNHSALDREFQKMNEIQYLDKAELKTLNQLYLATFNSEINFTELFTPESFGRRFGPSGSSLPYYSYIDKFVQSNSKDSIITLITSTNLEKQLYGVWGLKLFIEKGGQLDSSDILKIKTILDKSGLVYNVEGCDMSYVQINNIIESYNLKFDF